MVRVYGHIPFGEFYTQPWGKLFSRFPGFPDNLGAPIPARYALNKDANKMLGDLSQPKFAGLSFLTLMSGDATREKKLANELLTNLWMQHAVALPVRPEVEDARLGRLRAARRLIKLAPKYTYRMIFETSKKKAGPLITRTIEDGYLHGLFAPAPDDRCCGCSNTVPPVCTCQSLPYSRKHCGQAVGDSCSLSSEPGCNRPCRCRDNQIRAAKKGPKSRKRSR